MLRSLLTPVGLLTLLLPLASARPQSVRREVASPFLDRDHWAVSSARRILTLGHTSPRSGWLDGSNSHLDVGVVLHAASIDSLHDPSRGEAFARALWERFAEEFPATAARILEDVNRSSPSGEGGMNAGVRWSSRTFAPGFAEWIQKGGGGPLARGRNANPDVQAMWSTLLAPFLALDVSARHGLDDWDSSEAYALFRYGPASLWLGRRALGYGPGESGGLILNPTTPFTGGGILLGPTTLPSVLRYFGPVRFEGFLSRIDSSFAVKDPWIMVNHGSFSPHPRLLLGLTHGAIFAGSGRPPFTPRNFFAMVLLGRAIKGSAEEEFENQLVAGEIRWRPPLGASRPVELHVAWGTEDNQGAWYEVPATQFGARIAALPTLPEVSFGVERTEFEPPCPTCGNIGFNSNWYRHYIYKAGWTVDQQLLGHPLGGNGVEWLAWMHAVLHDARLRLDGRAFYRERGPYNLFSPDLQGYGHGGRIGASFRFHRKVELLGSLEMERLGNDDLRSAGFVGVKAMF